MITRTSLAATMGLALMLGACGDPEIEEAEMVEMPDETEAITTTTMSDFDPLSREYTLSVVQQERRDAFDPAEFRTEYEGYRTAMGADRELASMTRADMEFSTLDRDGNGQLSVAEYALYAAPEGSDELDDAQVGRIADSYYFYDTDGDGYISVSEFTSLRAGAVSDAETDLESVDTSVDAAPTMSTDETM